MQKKLTVGDLRTALEGLPEDLVIEIVDGTGTDCERFLQYVKRLQGAENEDKG